MTSLKTRVITAIFAAGVLFSATQSQAGLTISDQRYWPNEVHALTDSAMNAQASMKVQKAKERQSKPSTECQQFGDPRDYVC
jgi:hypothetical protein